jgi:hypothetical protein
MILWIDIVYFKTSPQDSLYIPLKATTILHDKKRINANVSDYVMLFSKADIQFLVRSYGLCKKALSLYVCICVETKCRRLRLSFWICSFLVLVFLGFWDRGLFSFGFVLFMYSR